VHLNNLAHSLQIHFEQLKKLTDLEEVICLYHKTVQLIPKGHVLRSCALCNLVISLQYHFEQPLEPHKVSDLHDAFNAWAEAIDVTPANALQI
jgi:hypothetical protein